MGQTGQYPGCFGVVRQIVGQAGVGAGRLGQRDDDTQGSQDTDDVQF